MNQKQFEFLLKFFTWYRERGLTPREAFIETLEDYVFIYGDGQEPRGILDNTKGVNEMTVEDELAESIRKNGLSRRERAYIASMPERDKVWAPMMIRLIQDLYELEAVHRPPHAPGFDRYTYVSVQDVLFRKCSTDGIILLEMQDFQSEWHVLAEADKPEASKKEVLAILRSKTLQQLGFHEGEGGKGAT